MLVPNSPSWSRSFLHILKNKNLLWNFSSIYKGNKNSVMNIDATHHPASKMIKLCWSCLFGYHQFKTLWRTDTKMNETWSLASCLHLVKKMRHEPNKPCHSAHRRTLDHGRRDRLKLGMTIKSFKEEMAT